MSERARFGSPAGTLLTMIGVAVGLGNVWRLPYMVGRFGGAAFVLCYAVAVLAVGVPALVTEWTLGRHTRRGPVGAFARGGLPAGRLVGWCFFGVVAAATAYYTNVVGWVLYHALGEIAAAIGVGMNPAAILPPTDGVAPRSLVLQLACTSVVILACCAVLLKGLRRGIERASTIIIPALVVMLLILIARSLTLPGAWEGVRWYALKVDLAVLDGGVVAAALGQAVFSLSLGGTFMVVYGSYLAPAARLPRTAIWTASGDLAAGILAGFAIFPAVFALGLEPASGPGLIFSTLPGVFEHIPVGWLFGLLFFVGLFGAAYLSDVAAFEVLVAGLTDNTGLTRTRAVWVMAGAVLLLAIPPMLNTEIFVRWDLTFGSGMQVLGALLAVVTVGWAMDRSAALRELAAGHDSRVTWVLYLWIRYVVPAALVLVGAWWLLTEAVGVLSTG